MKRSLLGGMAAAALLAGALVTSPASALRPQEAVGGDRCKDDTHTSARVGHGTSKWRDPNHLTRKQAAAMESRMSGFLQRNGIKTTARPNGSVKIPVDFHVITKRDGTGNVSDRRIERQMTVLNNSFAGRTSASASDTPFRFRLASVERVRNGNLYNMNYEDSKDARQALRVGDAQHLNIYTVNFAGDLQGLLGFATFPETYRHHPRLDGIVMLNESLPGGEAAGGGFAYNRGDTLTHEVGHWLNLYHTFQGGCGKHSDYVVDTAWQLDEENIFYCRAANTCGNPNSRPDPIHNFMSYGDDPCLHEFTRGQRDRMNISWYVRLALS